MTLPVFVGSAVGDAGSSSTITYTNTFTSIPLADGDTLFWVIMIQTTNATLSSVPSGWTLKWNAPAVGSRTVLVYTKTWHTGDPTTLPYKKAVASSDGNLVFALRGYAAELDGTPMLRKDQSPANSFTNTAPSITTTEANTRVFLISAEATTAAESGSFASGPTMPSGWTQDAFKPQNTGAETITVAHKDMATPGATGNAVITYQNTQASNGWAVQIGFTSLPPTTDTALIADGSGGTTLADVWIADGAGGKLPATVSRVGFGVGTPSAFINKYGAVMGHLGESWDEVEGSLEGLTKAMIDGADGIMISIARTSDGVYFLLNDTKYLDRMSLGNDSGTTLDSSAMTWAQVQAYDQGSYWTQAGTATPRRPYITLLDFLAAYPGYGPIMVDPKTITSPYFSEILDILDAHGGPARFVCKNYIVGTTWRAAAQARGYLTWGYGYGANMGVSEDWPTLAPGWDWLGLDLGTTQANWNTALSFGKPVIGHIAKSQANYDTGMSKGAQAMMVAAVHEVTTRYAAPTESYFPYPSTPPVSDGTEAGAGINLGNKVVALVDGVQALGVRVYLPAAASIAPYLFDTEGTILASGPTVAAVAGWNRLPFSTPYTMIKNDDSIFGFFQTATRIYDYTAAAMGSDIISTDGKLEVYGTGARYNYDTSPGLFETNGSSIAWYGVQLIYR